ncbi:MAG: glycosyltransferase [Pseudomonadota bacterium]
MRILLSIPSLMLGGAERQLTELAVGLSMRGHTVLVVALDQGGPLDKALGKAQLVILGKRGRWDNFRVALRLASLLRSFKAHAHYAFLTTPCVLGALLKPLAPASKLVMSVRATDVEHNAYVHSSAEALLHRIEARLANQAALIISNSHAGKTDALARGFPANKTIVQPNGIDTTRFRPNKDLGEDLRQSWGCSPTNILIGLVARLDPMKDHPNFLRAAALLATSHPETHFVCVGGGPETYTAELRHLAERFGLTKRLVWTGVHTDMHAVYNALDALCLSSAFGEGFPNVLGEAMSCGVPCCATAVGDVALVLGETGVIVPIGDSEALATGLDVLLSRMNREGSTLRAACRQRIVSCYSVERMVTETEALLMELCGQVRP